MSYPDRSQQPASAESPPTDLFDVVEKGVGKLETIFKVLGGLVLGGTAVATVVVSISVKAIDAFQTGEPMTLSISPETVLALIIFGAIGVTNAVTYLIAWWWKRLYFRRLREAWKANIALLPEFQPQVSVDTTSNTIAVTLRTINRSTTKWHVRAVDWSTATFRIGDATLPTPQERALQQNVIEPWSDWRQQFVSPLPEGLPPVAALLQIGNVVLHVIPDGEHGTQGVIVGSQTMWVQTHVPIPPPSTRTST